MLLIIAAAFWILHKNFVFFIIFFEIKVIIGRERFVEL